MQIKIVCILSVFILTLSLCGCNNKVSPSAPTAEQAATNTTQPVSKAIESADDLIGVWRCDLSWSASEAQAFGKKSFGIENFTTTTTWSYFHTLKADGTEAEFLNFDLQMQATKDSIFTIFAEAAAIAKNLYDENTYAEIVKRSFGYEHYVIFSKKAIPDENRESETYQVFFQLAYEDILKYKNKPIEEQAAIGAVWGEMLKDLRHFQYVDGEWVAITSYTSSWSYNSGMLTIGEATYTIQGTNQQFVATYSSGKDAGTWIRIPTP